MGADAYPKIDAFLAQLGERRRWSEEMVEDQMALLGERAVGVRMEQEVSLRLLRHYASSVRHNQYQDTDVITVRVESAPPRLT